MVADAPRPVRLAVLASGSGTNAQRIMDHFRGHALAEVVVVGCDRPRAGVIQRAWDAQVPVLLFNGTQLKDGSVLRELQGQGIDAIVLAGFLRLIPAEMVQAFPGRIVNIHPALLPKYGGAGYHGEHVHRAVIAAGESKSGISIHLVDERFDEGPVLFQAHCPVLPDDTPASLAERIHALEHAHYPAVLEQLITEGRWAPVGGTGPKGR